MDNTLNIALEYASLNLAVIPVPQREKRPVIHWGRYQNIPPTQDEIAQMFNGHAQNIAIVCGRASSNLVVLDADGPAAFAQTQSRLRSAGIDTWTVQRPANGSDHDGGGHFWLRTPKAVRSAKLDGLDIKGQGGYVLAPPSLHPGGGAYQFTRRAGDIFTLPTLDALDWLKLEAAPDGRHIPALAWDILRGEAEAMRNYATRSEATAAACASLAGAGFDFWDALRLFRTFPATGKFAELNAKNPENAQRWLSLTWHNVTSWLATQHNEVEELAQRLKGWALSRPWPGRSGSTNRAVFIAHCDIVQRCGCDPHGASARELAELAGCSWKTASNANKRLVDAGLLEFVQPATASWPARFALVPSCAKGHTQSYTNVIECVIMHNMQHDAFRWGGLNKSGLEILTILGDNELSETDITNKTGRHRTTVKRRLEQMRKLGLVEPLGDGYWRAIKADFDSVARKVGTAGTLEEQRRRHAQERRLHKLELKRGLGNGIQK